MSALPSPDMPANQQVDPVARFEKRYATAIEAVRVSKAHTDTAGWQMLYGDHTAAVRTSRRELARRMRLLADALELRGLNENEEKEIGDVKKDAIELREAEQHWQSQTVDPVRQPVNDARKLRVDAMNEARRAESDQPMLNVGLVELMRVAVDETMLPDFDCETGRVYFVGIDPNTGEEK